MSDEYRRQLLLLVFIAAVVLTAGLGLRDPWPADEPRFALIARDMAESGNWLFPHVGGVIYPDKPPLFFWLVAALYAVTGSIRVSFLAPGILAGLGTVLLVTDLGRRVWGPRAGIGCGAALLAIMQFPLQMKSGQIDGLLCFWTTLALYGLCRHLLLGPDWRWYALGGFAAGLGVITKGVGILPYLVLVPYLFAARRGWPVLRSTWQDRRWLVAPAATLLAVSLWLVPMLIAAAGSADPDVVAYRDNILFHQTVTRYANAWGHIRPPWYLWTNAAPWLWLPVTLLLPWLIPAWRRDLGKRDAAILLLGCWVLLVLVFFSLSAGKRSLYIFPAAPAVAMLAGRHAEALLQRSGVRGLLAAFVIVLGLGAGIAGMYLLMNPGKAADWITDVASIVEASLSLLLIAGLMLASVGFGALQRPLAGIATAIVFFWAGMGLLVAPAIDATRSGSALMQAVERALPEDRALGLVAWPEQFLLQSQRPVRHFGYRRDPDAEIVDATRWLAASPGHSVLLPGELVDRCFDASRVTSLGTAHRRQWYLADRDALAAACADAGQAAPQLVVLYTPGGRGVHAQ